MRAEKNFPCRSINKTEDHTKIVSMNRNIIIITDNTKRSTMRDPGHMTWSTEESIMDRNIGTTDITIGTETTVQVSIYTEICTTHNIPLSPTIGISPGLRIKEITILREGITIGTLSLAINKTGREVQEDSRISVTEGDSTIEPIMTMFGDRVILKFMMIIVDMTVRDVLIPKISSHGQILGVLSDKVIEMVTMMKVVNIISEMIEIGDNTKGMGHIEVKEVGRISQGIIGLIIDIQQTIRKGEVAVGMIYQ